MGAYTVLAGQFLEEVVTTATNETVEMTYRGDVRVQKSTRENSKSDPLYFKQGKKRNGDWARSLDEKTILLYQLFVKRKGPKKVPHPHTVYGGIEER